MSAPATQREFALEIVRRLRAAGFEALWAGGCVRDELLGIPPKDFDVATSARPEQVREVFGKRRTLPIGAAFGVITVLGPRGAGQIDVATFRTDATYSDGRHPDSVAFTDAQHDALRRDFTINGLFFDPVSEQVVDFVEGQLDLRAGVVRAIGDPRVRIAEDKLRMLRAVRFAATFEFVIDADTMTAVQQLAAGITTVSAERIGMEIRRMLLDANRAQALFLLRQSHLLAFVLPEFSDMEMVAWGELLDRLSRMKSPTLSVVLAAMLMAVPNPDVRELGKRLRYTNKEIERADWLMKHFGIVAKAPSVPWPKLQRVLVHEGAEELMALLESATDCANPAVEYCGERLSWPVERLNPPQLVDGGELIRHGLVPGPGFSALLEQVRDAQLEGQVATREEALKLVDRLRGGDQSLR